MYFLCTLTYTFFNFLVLNAEDTTLTLVHLVFRHGERTPERNEFYPKDDSPIESYFPLSYGELTNMGRKRQFSTGKKLRERYNDFLGPHYTRELIQAVTTDWDRTKMSLLLVLAGLFPPSPTLTWNADFPWIPIPYHYRPWNEDYFIRRIENWCPRYVEELQKVMASEEVLKIKQKYDNLLRFLNNATGWDFNKFANVFWLYQNLYSKASLNRTLPEWASGLYPETINELAALQCHFENYNVKQRRLNGGHIIKKFFDDAKLKINDQLEPKTRKMFLYSGHENNVIGVLAALGLYKPHMPPYGSVVFLELHYRNSSNEYGYKIFYMNDTTAEPHKMIVPGCSHFCPFDKLLKLLDPVLPGNITEECGSTAEHIYL